MKTETLKTYVITSKINGHWTNDYIEAYNAFDALDHDDIIDVIRYSETAPIVRKATYKEWDCDNHTIAGVCLNKVAN